MTLPYLDEPHSEEIIIPSDELNQEGNKLPYCIVKRIGFDKVFNRLMYQVIELDDGFKTQDPTLQKLIDYYIERKNEEELDNLISEFNHS